jgi:hypothetical protein
VFAIYRDMGTSRSLNRLEQLLKTNHSDHSATRGSLERWSRLHDWSARLKAHDSMMEQGGVQMLTSPKAPAVALVALNPELNQIDALLQAGNQALTRAMSASPIVTSPSDLTALVSAAEKALKLVETIKSNQVGKVSRREVADEIRRILGEAEKARRADLEQMLEAELKGGAGSSSLRQEKSLLLRPSWRSMLCLSRPMSLEFFEDVPEPAAAEPTKKPAGMRLFADVLKTFEGS